MTEFRVDVRADRNPELHEIVEWLKQSRISQATALDNALFTRYWVESLEAKGTEKTELLRAISSVRFSLKEQIEALDRKEARLTGVAPTNRVTRADDPAPQVPRPSADSYEAKTEDNVQEDCF